MKPFPSKFFLRFFRWFCRPDLVNYIEGDLIEIFNEKVQERGIKRARRAFAWEILKLLRPSIIRPLGLVASSSFYEMLVHGTIIFLRVFKNDRRYALFNVIGLALGSATFVIILQYTSFEKSYDQFHSNYPDLFRIIYTHEDNGVARTYATSPPIFAPFITSNIPEVKSGVRIVKWDGATFAYKNKKFKERHLLSVDSNFLQIFSFNLISGNPATCLKGIKKVVFTESMAKKYFGDENPIGKIVKVYAAEEEYTVTGVVQNPPKNSHIQFDFLISYWWYDEADHDSWYSRDDNSYLVLAPGTSVESVNDKIQALIESERGEINNRRNYKQYAHLQHIGEAHFSRHYDHELYPAQHKSRYTVNTLFFIGCFVLVMAWINFNNLATARATKRAKEIGVRKTMGAFRWQLIFQFMLESFLMNLLGLVLAILCIVASLGYLESIFGTNLPFESLWSSPVWSTLSLVYIIGSILSGIYPALVLSSFRPSKVLKSSMVVTGASGSMRKVLMTFQYGVSTGLIATALIIFTQLNYLQDKNLGFDPNNLLVLNLPDEGNHKLFMDKLGGLSDVTNITISESIPGEVVTDPAYITKNNDSKEKGVSFDVFHIGHNYFETLKVDLLAGRLLNEQFRDTARAVILNKTAVTQLGFRSAQDALGEVITINYKYPREIVGVVEDFHHLTAKEPVSPMIYAFDNEWGIYCIIRFSDNIQHILDESNQLLQSIYTNGALDYFFLDEYYNRQYVNDRHFSNTVFTFSGISISIACIGLFGLLAYSIEKRKKEISLRKIFGASVSRVTYILAKENLRLIVLATVLVVPIVYYFSEKWLDTFTYRIQIHSYTFLVAFFIVLAISLLTSISIIIKTANANPTNNLRNE